MFGSMLPTGMLVKQFLMGAGIRDPEVLAMVDALTAGGFEAPVIQSTNESEIQIPTGSKAIRVDTSRANETLTLVLIRSKKTCPSPALTT